MAFAREPSPPIPRERLYIACDDMDFSWTEKAVNRVNQMWKAGAHITAIARAVRRPADEVALLIMSLAREGKIEPRPGGVFGGGAA